MKFKNILLMAIGIFALGGNAAMASTEGHGGTGLMCQTETTPFQLYDLFQVSTRRYTFPDGMFKIIRKRNQGLAEEQDVQNQIDAAFRKLETINPEMANAARQQLQSVRIIHTSEDLPVLDIDGGLDPQYENLIPKGCENGLVGIMIWQDDLDHPNDENNNWLKVNDNKLRRLPVTDQAATWVHEAVTRVIRLYEGFSDYSAFQARDLVGFLFSTEEIYPQLGGNLSTSIDPNIKINPKSWHKHKNFISDFHYYPNVSTKIGIGAEPEDSSSTSCAENYEIGINFPANDNWNRPDLVVQIGSHVSVNLAEYRNDKKYPWFAVKVIPKHGSGTSELPYCGFDLKIYDDKGNPTVFGPNAEHAGFHSYAHITVPDQVLFVEFKVKE